MKWKDVKHGSDFPITTTEANELIFSTVNSPPRPRPSRTGVRWPRHYQHDGGHFGVGNGRAAKEGEGLWVGAVGTDRGKYGEAQRWLEVAGNRMSYIDPDGPTKAWAMPAGDRFSAASSRRRTSESRTLRQSLCIQLNLSLLLSLPAHVRFCSMYTVARSWEENHTTVDPSDNRVLVDNLSCF